MRPSWQMRQQGSDSRPQGGRSQWRDRAGLSPAASHRHDGVADSRVRRYSVSMRRATNEPGVTVTLRLQLLVPAISPGARHGLVGAGDNLDEQGREAVLRRTRRWPGDLEASCAPDRPCLETADLIGLHAAPDAQVRDWDLGSWTGKSLTEIATTSPGDLERWSTDPDFAVHGGESLRELRSRATDWLDRLETERHLRLVTVAPKAVVRAILLSVLDAPIATFWKVDLEPLASVHISLRPGRRAVRWSTGDARD